MKIDLTDDEYLTVMSALNNYGHFCLNASIRMEQKSTRKPNGQPYTPDEVCRAHRCGDKAFSMQRKLHDAVEVNPKQEEE